MAGNYRNSIAKWEVIIESWMRTIIRDGGVERYDHLHIDRIDSRWKDRNTWISAALNVYDLALNLRDRERFPFSVVLGFSLKSAIDRKGINFRTRAELEAELDQSPPSLYLFRPNQEPWTEAGRAKGSQDEVTIKKIDLNVLGAPIKANQCFYFEFRTLNQAEYSRSILIGGYSLIG